MTKISGFRPIPFLHAHRKYHIMPGQFEYCPLFFGLFHPRKYGMIDAGDGHAAGKKRYLAGILARYVG